jgi:hypothetical protein
MQIVALKDENVECWSADIVEHAALPTAVSGSTAPAVDFGSTEVRRRSIGSVGLKLWPIVDEDMENDVTSAWT